MRVLADQSIVRILQATWPSWNQRIAAPMVGGVVTSFLLELLIHPAVYTIWKWWAEVRPAQRRMPGPGSAS